MDYIIIFAWAFILEPLLEKIYQYLFCYHPIYLKLTAGNSYTAFSAHERLKRFHHHRQVVLMGIGILLLSIVVGGEVWKTDSTFLSGAFLFSLICIIEPLFELAYYKWSIGRYWKPHMTASEMTAYHDFCGRYFRHRFSLNGERRNKFRFWLMCMGILNLVVISFIL